MNAWMQPVGQLLLRLICGLGMMTHGYGKVFESHAAGLIEFATKQGWPVPFVWGWAGSLSEFFGGLFVAVGLLTRGSAFFIACTMGVAVFVAHAGDPFKSREMASLYLVTSVAILLMGPGPLSLDRLWGRGKGK